MKNILFGITGLTIGGAERVLIDIANKLSAKYNITILTIYAKGELEKQLCDKVKLKSIYNEKYSELNKVQKIMKSLSLLFLKKKMYDKYVKGDYDVEIAFLEGPITRLFSVKNDKIKKIAWIHNDITSVFGEGVKSKLKKLVDEKIYSKFRKLIFVSNDNLKKFNDIYPDINVAKKVIYNYIDENRILKKSKETLDIEFKQGVINFVTVARLVPQKAIDRLIKVHTKLIKENMMHCFYVIGEGIEYQKLKQLIKENNVQETFKLVGKIDNPYPFIKNSDYFCLFSKFEGYGMVLEEAKILHKPILITNTAAREAVQNYSNSYIADNTEEGIYNLLKNILNNKIGRDKNTEIYYANHNILENIEKLIED